MSQSFTITLPAGLPLLNANRRTHHHIRAVRTRTIRAAAIEAVAGHRPLMEALTTAKPGVLFQRARIVGYLRPARAGRADPANWYPSFKAAVDGLVDAGLLEDDDHTRLVGPDMRLGAKVAGGQLVLVIHDATNWTDEAEPVDRTAVLHEAADLAEKLASEMRDGGDEWPEEWSSREVRDAVESVADAIRTHGSAPAAQMDGAA